MPRADVALRYSKWDGSPHWVIPTVHLGSDRHGTWLGARTGTRMSRPGVDVTSHRDAVFCVPQDQYWIATVYATTTPGEVEVYVDLTTPPRWGEAEVGAVDLDLDVVLPHGGAAFVDDEDEFAEHQVRFGYPAELVATTERTCAWLLDAVRARRAPFDPVTPAGWLAFLADERSDVRGERDEHG